MRPDDLLARLEAGYAYDPMYGQLCNERDQLKAENASLRGAAQGLGELCDKYKAENAKLRKLVRKMWKPFCWAQSGYDVCLSDEEDREIRDMSRELRIEVGE